MATPLTRFASVVVVAVVCLPVSLFTVSALLLKYMRERRRTEELAAKLNNVRATKKELEEEYERRAKYEPTRADIAEVKHVLAARERQGTR